MHNYLHSKAPSSLSNSWGGFRDRAWDFHWDVHNSFECVRLANVNVSEMLGHNYDQQKLRRQVPSSAFYYKEHSSVVIKHETMIKAYTSV